jgi:uncharacterized membrane protein YqjE
MTAGPDFGERHPSDKREKPIGSLLADLARETSLLVRQEIALARAEAGEKLGQLRGGVVMAVVGAAVAQGGFLVLLATAVIALNLVLELWLSALIVGVVTLLIGGIFALIGLRRFQADSLVPRRTIRSLQDDREWAKEQVR